MSTNTLTGQSRPYVPGRRPILDLRLYWADTFHVAPPADGGEQERKVYNACRHDWPESSRLPEDHQQHSDRGSREVYAQWRCTVCGGLLRVLRAQDAFGVRKA